MLNVPDIKPNVRPGLYLVDKPSGPSSHDVVSYFRRKSGIKKVGHCGTLDPIASGLLIILVGREFTRNQATYLKKDKDYQVEVLFGTETDSYDVAGKILQQKKWTEYEELSKKDLQKSIKKFKGQIDQVVPIFSAIKINGQKLYQKAKKGQIVDLPTHQIKIKKITLKNFKKDVKKEQITCQLNVSCSSGTYIRSLVHDLGIDLGCGATVIGLRRTKIDKFNVKKAIKLERELFKMDWDN